MDIEKQKELVEREDGLSKTLGMEYISTPEPDTCLAENLAGVGSSALCPKKICVGINVSGNHVRTVVEGQTVTAYGKLQFKGQTLHEWQVDIKNEKGDLISTVHVTNYIITPPRKE